MNMTTHLPTLLLREWMQHKRGWLIAAFAPLLLALAALPFGKIEGLPLEYAQLIALVTLLLSATAGYGLCLLIALFQLPGLARRDVQDRSVEFWLSLPGRPSESVAATVLAHGWLAPLGGALAGVLLGLPIAATLLTAEAGMGSMLSVNWSAVVSNALPVLLRGIAGTVLLTLWLLPMILVLMAASAWLKRLGVPVVLVGSAVAVAVLHQAYGISWPLEALTNWNHSVNHSLVSDAPSLVQAMQKQTDLWAWAGQDLRSALADMASLRFVGWMALAAAGFAAVVAKRERGG
ncbi:hypothetical protein DBR42_02460 [Pelomonas sp. HMWF004]|nr:hypothetical protein DBR42_02460 [Pelomonas sp. HMWF004]